MILFFLRQTEIEKIAVLAFCGIVRALAALDSGPVARRICGRSACRYRDDDNCRFKYT